MKRRGLEFRNHLGFVGKLHFEDAFISFSNMLQESGHSIGNISLNAPHSTSEVELCRQGFQLDRNQQK